MDTAAFLQRIGIDRYDGPPRLEALTQLHEAFVDQVPYETVQYQLTPGGAFDPEEVAKRIVARETGGYCFQLNGTFALLLAELGYRVELHRGGVETVNRPSVIDGSHLVLTVSGLAEDPDRVWLVDAGLGDGLRQPMPLETGTATQYPFTLHLRPSEITDGWRLDHDPRANLIGMDFEASPVPLEAFAAKHAELSADPESPFVRLASAFRRTPESVVVLRSIGLSETFSDRVDKRLLDDRANYFAALADVFHLPLPHYTAADRDALWRRVWAQYEDFLARTNSS
ncbi:arylamine N-acetyltransferase family protein [Kribbella sp.]|uniref:arylamine N-acetyltransferase family protein n=1 Tax=Kribbella sp. TaxID=1871183 RepID=UPI002D2FEFC3|nr:arylamine N-acetyltransferase [Kribbella sp.]HZX06196.1 arylamine N-acetyltransferase [Kribbella sp.]